MFAILVPAALTPLILTLFWGERKAQKLGLVHTATPREDLAPPVKLHRLQRVWLFAEQLDLVGLVLLATAVALILVPMTLAQRAGGSWRNRAYFPSRTSCSGSSIWSSSVDDRDARHGLAPTPGLRAVGHQVREAACDCAAVPVQPDRGVRGVDRVLRLRAFCSLRLGWASFG